MPVHQTLLKDKCTLTMGFYWWSGMWGHRSWANGEGRPVLHWMTAISLLEWEGTGEVSLWETPQEWGVCSVMEARPGKSWHFSFLLFLELPSQVFLVKLKFWHTHNAIFKKRAGVFLAGSFCGLAKCMFPDLTQQSGKAGQGLGLFYSLISFCRGAMDFPALHIGTQVELINICLQKWTQWILIIFHIKTDILLRLTVYKLYWASNWIA